MSGAPRLDWQVLISAGHPKFMVKGHEAAVAPYGPCRRFLICETWAMLEDRSMTTVYRVRDAEKVTDAQVRAGKFSPVVGTFENFLDAIAFCDAESACK